MKKTLAVLLTAAMLMTLLAGCSGGGSTGGGSTGGASAPAQEDVVQEASFYEVTEPITIQWWHALEDQVRGWGGMDFPLETAY